MEILIIYLRFSFSVYSVLVSQNSFIRAKRILRYRLYINMFLIMKNIVLQENTLNFA